MVGGGPMSAIANKPLGGKCYGSIPHLPGSRLGPGDHKCPPGQDRICTVTTRDKHDRIVVQEKLDGSNVGIAMVNGEMIPLSRSGYRASSSKYELHLQFHQWAMDNEKRIRPHLHNGERLVGEWLWQAHGTRYELWHEPFVAFDLMVGDSRACYFDLIARFGNVVQIVNTVHVGGAISIEEALRRIGPNGGHGAIDPVEGAVWRVERHEKVAPNRSDRRWVVDFVAKFVRSDKVDGCYLPSVTGGSPIINKAVVR